MGGFINGYVYSLLMLAMTMVGCCFGVTTPSISPTFSTSMPPSTTPTMETLVIIRVSRSLATSFQFAQMLSTEPTTEEFQILRQLTSQYLFEKIYRPVYGTQIQQVSLSIRSSSLNADNEFPLSVDLLPIFTFRMNDPGSLPTPVDLQILLSTLVLDDLIADYYQDGKDSSDTSHLWNHVIGVSYFVKLTGPLSDPPSLVPTSTARPTSSIAPSVRPSSSPTRMPSSLPSAARMSMPMPMSIPSETTTPTTSPTRSAFPSVQTSKASVVFDLKWRSLLSLVAISALVYPFV